MKTKEVKTYDIYMLSTFFITFVFQTIKLFKVIDISLISDTIGQLALATNLAGLDWQYAISNASYYGWGYNFIFSIFFKLTSNPYIIYYAIRGFNILMVSLTAVLIYVLSEKLLGTNNRCLSCICASFLGIQSSIEWSTECSVFIAVWITAFLIIYVYGLERKTKKSYMVSFVLGIWLCYALTLHERNMTILFSVVILYVFVFLMSKKSLFDILPFATSLIVCYPLEQLLKNKVINLLWISSGGLKNTTVFNGNQFWFFEDLVDGISIMIGTVFSNMYTLINKTYGLSIVATVILFQILYKILSDKFLSRKEKNITTEQILMLFSFCATFIVILGIAVQWGRGIYSINFYSYKGLTYYRYYLVYFWPAILVTCLWLRKNKKFNRIITIVSYILISFFFIYVIKEKILFAQSKESRDLKLNNAWIDLFSTSDYAACLSFVVILLLLLLLCIRWKKMIYIVLVSAFIMTVAGNFKIDSLSVPQLTCSSSGGIYNLLSNREMEILSGKIYTEKKNYTLQYMLNRYTVVYEISNISEKNHIIFDTSYVEAKYGSDYKCYCLDENEYIYVHGYEAINAFDEIINE